MFKHIWQIDSEMDKIIQNQTLCYGNVYTKRQKHSTFTKSIHKRELAKKTIQNWKTQRMQTWNEGEKMRINCVKWKRTLVSFPSNQS